MLKYSLVENWLSARPNAHSAKTRSMEVANRENIIARMLEKNPLLTRNDILVVLNSFEEEIVETLIEGSTLNLPLFNTSFSISGVFDGVQDNFDKERHKLNINLTKGCLLRDAEKYVQFEKTEAITPQPTILAIKDSLSGTVNKKLTAMGVVELQGSNLKIAGDDPSCGLWFIGKKDVETKAEIIIENKPSMLIAVVPDLDKGSYWIKLVSQHTIGGRILKHPKLCIYSKKLKMERE
jgi:hypothetical protein